MRRSRESILHVLAEQHAWLSKYCVETSSAEEVKEEKAKQKEPVLSKL